MNEILFVVEEADDCSYRASAVAAAIHTEADSLEELHREIRDAVHCHFDEGAAPPRSLSFRGVGRWLGNGSTIKTWS
jgi:hypothetical protein